MFVMCSQIEIDTKYQKQTCGLCGNFDTISNDLIKDGKRLFGIWLYLHWGDTIDNSFSPESVRIHLF